MNTNWPRQTILLGKINSFELLIELNFVWRTMCFSVGQDNNAARFAGENVSDENPLVPLNADCWSHIVSRNPGVIKHTLMNCFWNNTYSLTRQRLRFRQYVSNQFPKPVREDDRCCPCVAATLTSYSENMERGGKYGEGSRGNLKQWHSQKSGMDSFLYRVDENMTASTYSLNKIPERNLESMSSHSAHSIPLYLMPRPNSVAGESLRPSCPSFSSQSWAFFISLANVNCISDSLMFSPSSIHAVFPCRPQEWFCTSSGSITNELFLRTISLWFLLPLILILWLYLLCHIFHHSDM